jgi:mono/diheme cytochrome c family protein
MKRLLFIILSAAAAGLFALALWQDTHREWARYQGKFLKTLERSERGSLSGGIKQLLVNDFDRVDRCTTCHLAIDKPQLALAEEPFKAHPGKYLDWHPVEKFGCTVCHGGQGLATESKAAHGDVKHWEEPLLRGSFIQASCAGCHGDLHAMQEHVPQLVQGKRLFQEEGCYGCHVIKDFGGQLSVELTQVGSKPDQLIHADFEMMPYPHDRIHWLLTKLHSPRSLNPGVRTSQLPPGEEEVFPTAMPRFGFTEEEKQALTVYMLSLRDFDPPSSYAIPALPQVEPAYATSIERGRALFQKFGCVGCHNAEGVGGRHNWNAALGEEVPPLLHVKMHYSPEELKDLLRNGRQPAYRGNSSRPYPSIYMPAWKDKIGEEDMDALVVYLYSLHDKVLQPAAAEPLAEATAEPSTDVVAQPLAAQ